MSVTKRRGWFREMLRHELCSYCGGPGGTVDHITPKAELGKQEDMTKSPWKYKASGDYNLTACCFECNQAKGDMGLLQFMLSRGGALDA